VTLTVEAPARNRVWGPQTVKQNSTATINPAVQGCPSVLLRVVSDADPAEEKQTFAVVAPLALQTVDVQYYIEDFQASVTASSDRVAAPKRTEVKQQY
jgi:hypothetical protein